MINVINRINIAKQDYKAVKSARNNFSLYSCNCDTVHFTSNTAEANLPDKIGISLNAVRNISQKTPGVIKVVNSGYLAQVFMYQAPDGKTYAIKKAWPDELKKHVTAQPIPQMGRELKAYKRLKGVEGIPELYGYSKDFDKIGKVDNQNHFVIVEWVDGRQISNDGTLYELDFINADKLKNIYNMISQFDQKGVLHNDLWAANMLFTGNGVNIIDFNRSQLFDPDKEHLTSNMKDFKERFLWRYLSDVRVRKGEKKFLSIYKYTLGLEADLLKKRADFELEKGRKENYNELLKESGELRDIQNNSKKLKEKALTEIFNSDIRCGKIYAKYFEFGRHEAIYSFKNAKDIQDKYPNIIKYDQKLLDNNINTLADIKKALNLARAQKPDECLELFNQINNRLKSDYPEAEQQEDYHKKLAQFAEVNIKYLETLKYSPQKALNYLNSDDIKKFFSDNKKITYYHKVLENLATKEDDLISVLKAQIPDFNSFWNKGETIIFDSNKNPVKAQISKVKPEDAERIMEWYKTDENNKPCYQDIDWYKWWAANIKNTEQQCEIFKLEVDDKVSGKELLGVVMVEPSVVNRTDGKLITLARGLEIPWNCNKNLVKKPRYKGIGTALMTYAVMESVKKNDSGIGLNSSPGAEIFYEKLFNIGKDSGEEKNKERTLAFDKTRYFFSLLDNDRKNFLIAQLTKYQNLKNKIEK